MTTLDVEFYFSTFLQHAQFALTNLRLRMQTHVITQLFFHGSLSPIVGYTKRLFT